MILETGSARGALAGLQGAVAIGHTPSPLEQQLGGALRDLIAQVELTQHVGAMAQQKIPEDAEAVWQAPELTIEQLEASIAQHSPQFLKAMASEADVVIMSARGFAAQPEAPYLWECLQYARLSGKAVTMAPDVEEQPVLESQASSTAEDIVARHLEDFGARLTEQPHQDYLAALKSTMLAAVEEALS